ncbi:hypothetical protein Acr_00g0015450 [Actinidia rufa]|uniref:Transmembrane protein n=1 Tax=Actinidia rufa TaxID=165716 RepID=A0A7J0DCC4_9ERIC|nr:hypothetical protein Acr_00g0015450 [Actinidia rufa]
MMADEEDEQTRVFYEMGSMIIHILRFPNPLGSSSPRTLLVSSPSAFASLFIGISVALMMFGSVTFVIGVILMPWVVGLVLLFYFAGIVTSLSRWGRSILCPASPKWPNNLPG